MKALSFRRELFGFLGSTTHAAAMAACVLTYAGYIDYSFVISSFHDCERTMYCSPWNSVRSMRSLLGIWNVYVLVLFSFFSDSSLSPYSDRHIDWNSRYRPFGFYENEWQKTCVMFVSWEVWIVCIKKANSQI